MGLGNPGTRYENTRHNIGFLLFQKVLAPVLKLQFKKDPWHGLSASYEEGEEVVHFLMPQTYMNLSGEAILPFVKHWNIPHSHILVVHDELDLSFGDIRFRMSGSSAGHRGVESLIKAFGSDDFHRLRIGIGRSLVGKGSVDHVLETFSLEETERLSEVFDLAKKAVLTWIVEGPEKTRDLTSRNKMSQIIQKLKSRRQQGTQPPRPSSKPTSFPG